MSEALYQEDGVWKLRLAKNKPTRLCVVAFCSNPRPKGKKAGSICEKCKARRWRANNPVKAIHQTLRFSAARRRIGFNLTVEELAEFLAGTDYIERRGRGAECLSIDRINVHRGYEPGNLQVLTVSENSFKWHYEDRYQEIEYLGAREGDPF